MVLNDAGTIGSQLNGKSFPATEPYTAKVGDMMLVNYLNEGLMAHPMHLHQPAGWIIAKDGVPLDDPIPGDTINVAPGERYTVLYKPTSPACGPGTATSSTTPRVRPACSAWSPR